MYGTFVIVKVTKKGGYELDKKVKKTYRLNQLTVDRIQILKKHYASEGLNLSDGQIVEYAIGILMDAPHGAKESYGNN